MQRFLPRILDGLVLLPPIVNLDSIRYLVYLEQLSISDQATLLPRLHNLQLMERIYQPWIGYYLSPGGPSSLMSIFIKVSISKYKMCMGVTVIHSDSRCKY